MIILSENKLNLKYNSIGFIRFFLAFLVLYAHAFELGGFGHDFVYHLSGDVYSLGAIAVDGFFALSGYLITSSYLRLKSLPIFLWHRILRIFPGYWICLIVVGIGLPLLFGNPPDIGYIGHNFLQLITNAFAAIVGFVIPLLIGWLPNLQHIQQKILLFQGQDIITPLFINNPIPNVINGSLWTLEPEFRAYLLIGLLGFVGVLRKNFTYCLLLLVWVAYVLYFKKHPDLALVSNLRLPAHFLAGAAFYFWNPPLKPILAAAAFVLGAIALLGGFYPVVSPLTITYLLLWLAAVLPFQSIGRIRDYSYGLYIYAYPVQQTIAAYKFTQWGYLIYLLLSVICTLIFASLSWHFIEKPALKCKDIFSRKNK